ncbi:MAG: hypothetical protein Q9180_003579 [Flavoplaca navasiana]
MEPQPDLEPSSLSVEDLQLLVAKIATRVQSETALRVSETARADSQTARADSQDALLRPTTFEEMLKECHEHLASNFVLQPDPKKITRGEATCVEGKSCPSSLQPWLTFPNEQEDAFIRANTRLQPIPHPQRRFESVTFYRGPGRNLAGQLIGSEMDLRHFQASAVEAPVKEIMEALDLPVFFENNPRPLDSTNEEVVARTLGVAEHPLE